MSNSYHVSLPEDISMPVSQRSLPEQQHLRKRKRTHETAGSPVDDVITIYPYPNTNAAPPIILTPVRLLFRAQLPLAYLDTAETPNRIFRGAVNCLEERIGTIQQDNGCGPLRVLVAQDKINDDLYVVEGVSKRTYALCKLWSWISEKHLEGLSKQSFGSVVTAQCLDNPTSSEPWWQAAAIPEQRYDRMPDDLPRKAPRLSMICKRTDTVDRISRQEARTRDHATAPAQVGQDQVGVQVDDGNEIELVPEELFDAFVRQYLDALYLSKTPLAYFAKGPISRIRSAFSRAQRQNELADFLRGLIMSSSTADKKHKDVFLEALKDMRLRQTSDAEPNPVGGKKRKTNSKHKLDKQGLMSNELDLFHKWFQDDDSPPHLGETAEQQFRRRSSSLRTRETFLQVIVVLEILSLVRGVNAEDGKTQEVQAHKKDGRTRKRAPQDLSLVLELLLDKLCIWHSLDAGLGHGDAGNEKRAGTKPSNQLKDFCVEVIVPFYASKAPDAAILVNKKLGGPSPPSPIKHSRSAKQDDQRNRKPAERKPREPLHRISSENIGQASRTVPSLRHSNTDSAIISGLKSELSEIPLERIPRKLSQPAVPRRTSALDKMRIRQREVDFDAMSQVQEARKKKQAEVEEKIKEAIHTLKRPNRSLAVKEVADASEQRRLMAQARAKAAQSQRNRTNAVQINATPKHHRTQLLPIDLTPQAGADVDMYHPPPSSSSVSMIPSSSVKPPPSKGVPYMDEEEVPQTGHRPRYANNDATPSKDSAIFAKPALPASGVRPLRLTGARNDAVITSTPRKKEKTWTDPLPHTPVRPVAMAMISTPPIQEHANVQENHHVERHCEYGRNEETNIYDALGWND